MKYGALITAATIVLAAFMSDAAGEEPSPDLRPLLTEMRKLVQRYYPQATLTLKNQTILFEFNTRKFMIHEPDLRGNWQDAYPDIGPQKGGIHGELDLRHGQYGGMAVVPVTVDKRYFVLYVTAPYSAKLDQHLYIHLKYPHDVSKEFREKFDHLVNSFDKHVKPAKP